MTKNMYHGTLRVLLLVCACVLVFDSGIVVPLTKELSNNAMNYMAASAVGVFVGVEQTELNTITAELTERERALDEREAALGKREISTRDFGTSETQDYSTFILSAILFVLTVLIVLNYVLDWNRMRRSPLYERQTI